MFVTMSCLGVFIVCDDHDLITVTSIIIMSIRTSGGELENRTEVDGGGEDPS